MSITSWKDPFFRMSLSDRSSRSPEYTFSCFYFKVDVIYHTLENKLLELLEDLGSVIKAPKIYKGSF